MQIREYRFKRVVTFFEEHRHRVAQHCTLERYVRGKGLEGSAIATHAVRSREIVRIREMAWFSAL